MAVDKNLLERNINTIVEKIFSQALREFPGARKTPPRYEDQYAEIQIAPQVFLSFQKWADESRKPFFLILWRGSKFLMEFDLSRIIFSANQKLTWVLNIPKRRENRQHLSELNYKVQQIGHDIVSTIHQQMKACNRRAIKTPKGYILAQDLQIDDIIARFLEIVSYSVKSDQERDVTKAPDVANDDLKVLEGQIAESKILGRRRNQVIVAKRKNRDQFTCQACRFQARVNGRYIIECHHKYPLRGGQITSLNDLICLCPTCHRIAHRRDNPYSVEEIQSVRKGLTRKL